MDNKEKGDIMLGFSGDLPELKKKKLTRKILFIIILLVIAAIIIILVLSLRKNNNNKEKEKDRTKILIDDSKFKKPKNTIKKYQLIELEKSKYKFILIEDPKTLIGGIEVKTNLGYNTEYADGFAHYAEHIFFGGSEKVTELEFFNLIRQFGEILNANTREDETVFQIFGSNFTYDKLLEYFSSIMQNEKYNKTYLQTEIDVVTSEYDSNNISFNYYEIYRKYSNPNHPFSKTKTGNCGNKESLSKYGVEKLEEMLKNYYKILFKPENCILLLYSSKSLDEMRLLAQKYFDFKLPEPNQEYIDLIKKNQESLNEPLFLENSLGKIALYNSRRDTSRIIIFYHISQKSGNVDITNLLSYLLMNIKEKDTLIQYLYDKNYVSNFEVYTNSYIQNYELISFYIDLTDEGYNNIDKVIESFFATVNTLREEKNIQNLLNNMKSIDEINFINKEEQNTIFPDDINNLFRSFTMFGPEYMLGAPYDLLYNEKRTKEILEELSVDKSFIFIDSSKELKSEYLTSEEILYTENYKIPFRANDIPERLLNNLKTIKKVDEQEFKIRSKNNLYSKLNETTQKPCYQNGNSYECKYNEYDPNKDKDYLPYTIKNENNIFSLMKIDRSYGIPFIKGYIELLLDESTMKEILNEESNNVYYYLFLNSLNYKFSLSNLKEGGTTISISEDLEPKIKITFSTYNDLLNDVIKYILDFFNDPIDELSFNTIKEIYILYNSQNHDSSLINEMDNEMLNLAKRFLTADTLEKSIINKESVKNSLYETYSNFFYNIIKIITNIKYLTHGDISFEQANESTNKLSKLIKFTPRMKLKLSEKKIEIPEKSSFLYSYKSENKYQVQGGTLVLYEYDEKIKKEITLYSNCASSFIFDYLRTKRGSGYQVDSSLRTFNGKQYFVIISVGKVFFFSRKNG